MTRLLTFALAVPARLASLALYPLALWWAVRLRVWVAWMDAMAGERDEGVAA